MGAAQYDGRPSPLFAARLDHAIALYHEGVAPRIIVTGGKREGDRTTEAASAREYAIRHDVPEDAILVEDTSRTTLQSIRRVSALMDDADLRSAVFVSDPTHMLRVLRMAADVGIDAYGSPTRTSPLEEDVSARVDATVHELGALALYFVTGESVGSPPSARCARAAALPLTHLECARSAARLRLAWTSGRDHAVGLPFGMMSRGAAHWKVPSWRCGIGLVYCAKTCRPEATRAPTQVPRQVAPSPHRLCPARR